MNLKTCLALGAAALVQGASPLLAQPHITSFTPTFGYWNDPTGIMILGTGFGSGPVYVAFNGVQDTTAYAPLADGTQINAHVPSSAPDGSGPIYVWVNGFDDYSLQDFTVIGPGPYLSDFSPISGGSGVQVT